MTLIIAAKFGERIVVCSDTMITNASATRPNTIPGRLKTVIVSGSMSISYAGLAGPALKSIRAVASIAKSPGALHKIQEDLRKTTERHAGNCEFIVASHYDGAQIFRIWDGRVSKPLDRASIGDKAPIKGLSEQAKQLRKAFSESDGATDSAADTDETVFRSAFATYFIRHGVQVNSGVGGLPIAQLGSPYSGYSYEPQGWSAASDTVHLSTGFTPEQEYDRWTGMTEYNCAIQTSDLSGVAVLGAYFEQLKAGYLYSPLENDDAILFRQLDQDTFVGMLNRRARRMAGML